MRSSFALTFLFLLAAVAVMGASYYVTDVVQDGQLQQFEEARRVAQMTNARVADLRIRETASAEQFSEALARWNARYKYIPTELNTADMLEYVEGLTRTGFEQFDMHLVGQTTSPDFSVYTFNVTGMGTYAALYHVVWHLENNREFYQITDLQIEHVEHVRRNEHTGTETRRDLTSFKFTLKAFFAGIDGISAPQDSLRPVPVSLFPSPYPSRDIFNPLVRPPRIAPDALPANTEGLLNFESAKLVSIIGLEAVFEDAQGRRTVQAGDRIYLGTIEEVDPANSLVRARLVKGSRVEMVTRRLGDEQPYRRALGSVQLDPVILAPQEAAPGQ